MSAFTFDFDLEDDLDESFDAISLQDSTAAVPPLPHSIASVAQEELPAEEIPLSALVRALLALYLFSTPPGTKSYHHQYSSPRSPKRYRIRPSRYPAAITHSRDETSSMRAFSSSWRRDRMIMTRRLLMRRLVMILYRVCTRADSRRGSARLIWLRTSIGMCSERRRGRRCASGAYVDCACSRQVFIVLLWLPVADE
jgi:hypothetical protein